MSYDLLTPKPRQLVVEQNVDDPTERPRYWECFQCASNRVNVAKQPNEKRYICLILDVENPKLEKENDEMINPTMYKALKKCPYHPEGE